MRFASRRVFRRVPLPGSGHLLRLALVLVATSGQSRVFAQGGARPVADRLGVVHVDGKYHLTNKDFLNEGAEQIQALGSRVIKVWFVQNPQKYYPFNSRWPAVNSLIELAQTPYYRELF